MKQQIIQQNVKTLSAWNLGDKVKITHWSGEVQFGTIVKFGLNSPGEIILGIDMICDFEETSTIHFYNPQSTLTVIERIV